MKQQRVVSVSIRTPHRASTKLWVYGYADLAKFLGCTESTLRGAISRGRLDPSNLESIFEYKKSHRPRPRKEIAPPDIFDPNYNPYATWVFDN